jgi:hypothetical protein
MMKGGSVGLPQLKQSRACITLPPKTPHLRPRARGASIGNESVAAQINLVRLGNLSLHERAEGCKKGPNVKRKLSRW